MRCRVRLARLVVMVNDGNSPRELSRLVVPQRGSLEATGDLFAPYRLVDPRRGGRRRRFRSSRSCRPADGRR